MIFVHIMGAGSMYVKHYYQLISEHFNCGEDSHYFVSRQKNHPNFRIDCLSRCEIVSSLSLDLLRLLKDCDFIIVHGMNNEKVLAFFLVQPWLLRKTNWVIWGGDIYFPNGAPVSFRERIVARCRSEVYSRIPFATRLALKDYDYARTNYGLVAKCFEATYPVAASDKGTLATSRLKANARKGNRVVIQIGNSATKTNQHFEVLDAISRFKDRDIEIFMPLNYGAADYKEYADRVILYARKIFGDKVVALTERITGEEYLELLARVDVGIFNNNRQQAMGNISQLVLCGSKIYIRHDTTMWSHFRSLGCSFDSCEKLSSQPWEEFLYYDEAIKGKNIAVVSSRHDVKEKRRQWGLIFEAMKSDALSRSCD